MLRILITSILSAMVAADGIAMRSNLRAGHIATGASADFLVQAKASVALKALLHVATDSLSSAFYKGMTAPLNQLGYEQVLGNAPMTAFITKYIESQGLTITDSGALQGFVMYYDGSCTKKAFKDLVEEMAASYEPECHGSWLANSTSLLQTNREVSQKEYDAILEKEAIIKRAAAYSAAMRVKDGQDDVLSVRKFLREYITELNGKILDDAKFNLLVKDLTEKIEVDDPIESMTDGLIADAESTNPCVEMPSLASRSVVLLEGEKEREAASPNSLGNIAPLNQAGYLSVANLKSIPEMSAFINRSAISNNLEVTSQSNLDAFSLWYNSQCAFQTYDALVSELNSIGTRPVACGGGWIQPIVALAQISDLKIKKKRHMPKKARKQ